MSEQKYFIIRKDKWFDGKVKFQIMKDASFTLDEATRNLLAYDQLNDNKDYSTFRRLILNLWRILIH